jgi:hypothetical protein
MKAPIITFSLFMALGLLGCSKEGGFSSGRAQRLVFVPIRDGKIVRWHESHAPETTEMLGFLVRRTLRERGMLAE